MPGSRLPAYCTSLGRVLLATLPEHEARRLVFAADLTPRTPRSLTDPEEILAAISRARRDGFALVDQEIEIGLRSLAVPVLDGRGRTVAALNTGMAATQAAAGEIVSAYLPALLKTQAGLKRVL